MNSSHIVLLTALVLVLTTAISTTAEAQADYPRLVSVTPDTGSAGDEISVEGENLGKEMVREIYLTDGQTDWKLEIVDQSATAIRCRIAADVKSGRHNLMVLTRGANPRLIEQPVKVTVE